MTLSKKSVKLFDKNLVTSGETDGVMKKLKSMIPEITNSNRDFERKKTDISPANSSSVKIKRLDDQFSRMFKDKQK